LNFSRYQSIDKSAKIFDNKLRHKLGEIFEMFDLNGQGRISADEVNLDLVSAQILQIFKPLLCELEAFDEELDREEFIESSLALLEK
jgi:Ca2+-binding EF-hand superfamily protein